MISERIFFRSVIWLIFWIFINNFDFIRNTLQILKKYLSLISHSQYSMSLSFWLNALSITELFPVIFSISPIYKDL